MGIYDTVNGVYQYMEVHPTFLYESLWNLVGFLLLALVVAKHRKFDGQIFLGYITWYGLGRAWIEGLRTDSLYFFSTGLRVSQILALISFVLALAVMIVQLRRKNDPKELWVNQVKARKAAAATGAEEGSAIMDEPENQPQEELEEKEEDTDDPA